MAEWRGWLSMRRFAAKKKPRRSGASLGRTRLAQQRYSSGQMLVGLGWLAVANQMAGSNHVLAGERIGGEQALGLLAQPVGDPMVDEAGGEDDERDHVFHFFALA